MMWGDRDRRVTLEEEELEEEDADRDQEEEAGANLHRAVLKEIALGLKDYIEYGRREDGWVQPSSSPRRGHAFDVALEDRLSRYFGKLAAEGARRSSSGIMRRKKESTSKSSSNAIHSDTSCDSLPYEADFEDRKMRVQEDIESTIRGIVAKEQKARRRKASNKSTSWKGHTRASGMQSNTMPTSSSTNRKKRKAKTRSTSLPSDTGGIPHNTCHGEADALAANELGVELLFDMAAEAVVLADKHQRDIASASSFLHRTSKQRRESQRQVGRRASLSELEHEALRLFGPSSPSIHCTMLSTTEHEGKDAGNLTAYVREEELTTADIDHSSGTRGEGSSRDDEELEGEMDSDRLSSPQEPPSPTLIQTEPKASTDNKVVEATGQRSKHKHRDGQETPHTFAHGNHRKGAENGDTRADRKQTNISSTSPTLLDPFSSLKKAIRKSDTSAIASLLEESPGLLGQLDDCKRAPLHYAAGRGRHSAMEELLIFGAAIDHQNPEGFTALHFACTAGSAECVKILLHYGANVNHKGKDAMMPLHLACASGHLGVVELLLLNEATKLQPLDATNRTPGQVASALGHYQCEQAIAVASWERRDRLGDQAEEESQESSAEESDS